MSMQKIFHANAKSGHVEKSFRISMAVLIMCSIMVVGFVTPEHSKQVTRISGIGYPSDATDCDDAVTGPDGQAPDIYTRLEGDLEGCQYAFIATHRCTPSGVYIETGTETYVFDGSKGQGTFDTTYVFIGRFEGCGADGFPTGAEIAGGCNHPIVPGTGTGDFAGVKGRILFRDDVVAGNFPYTGHLRW
jgi:hypothetical protein